MNTHEQRKDDASRILKELSDYIAKAQEILSRGDFIELNGLDDQVKHLCDAVAQMKIEDSLNMKGELEHVMESLNDLQQAFINSKQDLERGLHEATKHRQASMAYKQSESNSHREGAAESSEPKE